MGKKLVIAVCLFLLVPVAALSPAQPKEGTKAPTPSKTVIRVQGAYGVDKGFCCQTRKGCISGPKDGSEICKSLGGKPFTNSFCAMGTCYDP